MVYAEVTVQEEGRLELNDKLEKDLFAVFSDFSRLQEELVSSIWDLITVSDLNSSYVKEMVASTRESDSYVSNIHIQLENIKASSSEVVQTLQGFTGSLQDGTRSFEKTIQVMKDFVVGLAEMGKQFAEFKLLFQKVEDSTKKITDAVRAIEDISELTNLLSINAAIEAARAGEHGKGFKVVASEVKKLAEQSTGLTRNISGLLEELETSISSSNSRLVQYDQISMSLNRKIAVTQGDLDHTKTSLNEIGSKMNTVVDSADKQSGNIELIYKYVEDLSRSTMLLNATSKHITNNLGYQDTIINGMKERGGFAAILAGRQDQLKDALTHTGSSERILRVGHDVAYPPWVYIENGKSAGLSIDIIEKISAKLGYVIKFIPEQFEVVLKKLINKEVNVILNIGWPNEFFSKMPVISSQPYAVFEPVAFIHQTGSDKPVNFSTDFIQGKRVAVQTGSYVTEAISPYGCEIVDVKNDIEGMAKLIWKEVDAIITEREVGKYLSHKFFQDEIVPVTDPYKKLDVVMVFHESEQELREKVNSAVIH